MADALLALRRELHAFTDPGLRSLLSDLSAGRRNVAYLPGRKSWCSCPLSYRGGFRGSVDRDCEGKHTNDFTLAWDGEEGLDYFDEAIVLAEVSAEIRRRRRKRRRRRGPKQRRAAQQT